MLPRIGIVATPDQVTLLVPILQSLAFQVTAIWCKNAQNSQKLKEKYNIPFQAVNFQELLLHPEVDLVYVTTDPGMHAEVAVKALTSGKHCICQKPPSICQSEVEKMVSLSRYYAQLVTLLESHLRFLPAVAKMKEMIASGYCGTLLVIESRVLMGSLISSEGYNWRCDHTMGGGVLNTIGSHIIDLVTYISSQQAVKVHGCLKTFKPNTDKIHGYRTITSDDFCSFQLCCSKGLSATVTLNTHAPGKFDFEFSVTGTNGRLTLRGLNLHGCKNSETEELIFRQDLQKVGQFDLFGQHTHPPEFYHPIVVGCREMFHALKYMFLSGSASTVTSPRQQALIPAATFEDGIYLRTVLDAIFESDAIGKWVDIPKTNLVESTNPFWTSSAIRVNGDKPSPKSHRPVFV